MFGTKKYVYRPTQRTGLTVATTDAICAATVSHIVGSIFLSRHFSHLPVLIHVAFVADQNLVYSDVRMLKKKGKTEKTQGNPTKNGQWIK